MKFSEIDSVYLQQCQARCEIIQPNQIRRPSSFTAIQQLERSTRDPEFERLMRNRRLLGHFRYGDMRRPSIQKVDYLGSMRRRLFAFERDGNLEHLVDVANICYVVFANKPPGSHFTPSDDSHEHAREIH